MKNQSYLNTKCKFVIKAIISCVVFISPFLLYHTHYNKNKIKVNNSYIPYFLKIYEADSFYIIGNYDRSFELLDSLFTVFTPKNTPYYYEYSTYIKSSIKSKNYMFSKLKFNALIEKFGYNMDMLKNDEDFSYILSEYNYTASTYDSLRLIYVKNTHLQIKNLIKDLKIMDKKYRSGTSYLDNFLEQSKIDDYVGLELKRIFDSIGFPSIQKLGLSSNEKVTDLTIDVLLLHTNFDDRENYFLPKILEFINNGECNPEIFGYMYDQMMIYSNKKPRYGAYSANVDESLLDSINFYRKKIGMPKYGYKEWRMKRLYNF